MESATRYWRAYSQGKKGDTGRENRLVDAVEEGGGGANGERRTGVSARPRAKRAAGGKLLFSTGSSALSPVMTGGEEWRRGGRLKRQGMCVYI